MNKVISALILIYAASFFFGASAAYAQDENKVLLGTTVLMIGDSQTAGNFGRELKDVSFARGVFRFAFEGRVGWGVPKWNDSFRSSIPLLLRRYKPDLVIIQLGGNDSTRSGRIDYDKEVLHLWNRVQKRALQYNDGAKFCWIGPPTAVKPREDIQKYRERAANKIKAAIGEKYYINSFDITGHFGRSPDGVHFTPGGARLWAIEIMPRIEQCFTNQ